MSEELEELRQQVGHLLATNARLVKKLSKTLDLAEGASASRMMAIESVEALQDEVASLKEQVRILEETRDLLRDEAKIN